MILNIRNDFLQMKDEDYNAVIAMYDMTDKMVQETMESMQQWYKMQPHLPEGYLSDDRLFRHLLVVGFSMEKAKEKIDNMLTARNIVPELTVHRDPAVDWYKNTLEFIHWGIIPIQMGDMSRVMVINFTPKNTTHAILNDIYKAGFMMMDYKLSADLCAGDHVIVDFKELKIGHISKMTPSNLKKIIFVFQDCFGAKIKGLHYVNVPKFAELIMSIMKAGLSKKIASRLHIYKDYESLHKVIPKTHLPLDFGGVQKSVKELSEDLLTELCKPEWRDWFIQQDAVKVDESKRVGVTSDMSSQLLGMQGSFRKLDFD